MAGLRWNPIPDGWTQPQPILGSISNLKGFAEDRLGARQDQARWGPGEGTGIHGLEGRASSWAGDSEHCRIL